MTILTKDAYSYPDPYAPLPSEPAYRYDPAAIANYVFPAGMVTKLMAEQKWTGDYTARVLTEYRRFIHLAATMNHEVTPSLAVDEAWHMHLTFSRDYWEKLTPLLPAPLHHEPGEGLPDDKVKYAEQYRRTLEDYQTTFGEAPPADIWRVAKPKPPASFKFFPALFWTGLLLWGLSFFVVLTTTAQVFLGTISFVLIGNVLAAMHNVGLPGGGGSGSVGGGSCGGASCGFTGGDSCDSGSSDGGSCGDSGGSSCGGGGCGGGGCGS